MRIGVLGTGTVGHAVATRLVELGHDVVMGSRDATNPKAIAWADSTGAHAAAGDFAAAATHGELVVNATAGTGSLAALAAAGDALAGKVLLDIANALDFSGGMPPSLAVANTDSLGEQIQRAHPRARVVKTLNTVTADVMVHPGLVAAEHSVFVAGDDAEAKATAAHLLEQFGWPRGSILDLGGIQAARGMEMYLPLWLSLRSALGTAVFNVRVVRA